MRIELIDEAEDGLNRSRWEMVAQIGYSSALNVVLSTWRQETRQTRRHKWVRSGEGYSRRSHNGHHHWGMCLPAAEVPSPDRLEERVRDELLSRLAITWARDPAPR